MFNKLISVVFLLFMVVSSAFLFCLACLIWLGTVWFDKRLVILHMFSSFWASLYLWLMPAWRVSIQGRDKMKDRASVIVSNHQSALDILVAFRLFFPFKWVSKAENFKIPFIGWNMYLNRYIKLWRGNKESSRKMMAECEAALAQGNSIYMFPEGTRSKTGMLKEFKPGAFILAHQMKVPIVPIAINGTMDALPKNSLDFHGRHYIHVIVLDEIPYADFAHLSVEETAQMVKQRLSEYVESSKSIRDTCGVHKQPDIQECKPF